MPTQDFDKVESFPNTSKIEEVINEIKNTGKVASDFFSFEATKYVKILTENILVLNKELTNLIKEVVELERLRESISKEVLELEQQKDTFDKLKNRLDKKSNDINQREENLLALHKTLENKRLMLEARENELDSTRFRK